MGSLGRRRTTPLLPHDGPLREREREGGRERSIKMSTLADRYLIVYLCNASHPGDVWLYDISTVALQKLSVSISTEQYRAHFMHTHKE